MIKENEKNRVFQELNVKYDVFTRELIEVILDLPMSVKEQIRSGGSIKKILSQMFQAAHLGNLIDGKIREQFKLSNFMLEDCEVDLVERTFWLYYIATSATKLGVDTISLWLEGGGVTMLYDLSLSNIKHDDSKVKEEIEKVEEQGIPFLEDVDDYTLEYVEDDPEFPSLNLYLWDGYLAYLPDVNTVSELFGKIIKNEPS